MWATALRHSALGIEIVVALAIGYFLGRWLDGRFGTGPWLTILFGLAGVGAAVKAVIRTTREVTREMQRSDDRPEKP